MSSQPKTYRIYTYDARMKSVSSELVEVLSDDEAIAEAEAAGFGSKCEIWEGNRLVAQLGIGSEQLRA
jgi:hypothetical protein